MASHATRHLDRWRARDEAIVESLVIPFAVVVLDVLRHGPPEVPLPDWNQAVKAFFFDRPHEAFSVGVRIGRALRDEDQADTRVLQSTPHITAPLPIPIADQDVRRVHRTPVSAENSVLVVSVDVPTVRG